MRAIDANMQNALAAHTRRPSVGLTIEDHTIHLSTYQVPGLADQWSDCCLANDGSILRVNLTRGSFGFTSNFQFSRITDPSLASQWSTVTTFPGGAGNMFQDGGCAISNNAGTLRAFAQQGTGGNALFVWTSANNGSTWTGPVTVLSPPGNALSKGIGSAGNNDVFFLYDVLGGDKLAVSTFNGTTWSALTNSTLPTLVGGAGVAAFWTGSVYNLAYSDGTTLFSATYNGSTWTQGTQIAPATSTAISRISPRLAFFDGLYHLVVAEVDGGSLSGAIYQYCRVRESADFIHWSDGWIIHEVSTQFGGNYFFLNAPQTGSSGARYYFAQPGTVLSTQAFSQANPTQYLDLSGAVLAYKRLERLNGVAEFVALIDNQGGVYNRLLNLAGGSTYEPLTPEAQLKLSEGYIVSGVPDRITTGVYRIQRITLLRSPQENIIQVTGHDLSGRLDRLARWQNIFTNQTLSWLLREVCARAGLFNLTLTGGSQLTQVVPTFVIQANQRYRKALDALCSTYGLVYFLDQTETLQVREVMTTDPGVWNYQNEIEQLSIESNFTHANHVIASGKPPTGSGTFALTTAEAFDDVANAATRVEHLLHHTDLKTTTSAQAQIAASLVLYTEQRARVDTRLVVPLNPALQLTDVVTVVDAVAPTGTGQSVIGRVSEHEAVFNAQHAAYESHFVLQGR